MIKLSQGNILKADAQAFVNTVNCVGVTGRGVALQFKKAFPVNFTAYEIACKEGQVQPGKMFIYDLNRICNPRFIINFPTKRHWKAKSLIGDIKLGLVDLIHIIKEKQIHSIAIPPLGCGLGGLAWEEVKPLIIDAFDSIPEVGVFLFEPAGSPQTPIIMGIREQGAQYDCWKSFLARVNASILRT
jgi:O-acetyl-ADP-ribose deacetylase (regulator of RNase III)